MGRVAVAWAIGGIFLLLGSAIYRITPIAVDALGMELTWIHWSVLLLTLGFMLYSEGYRGFQKSFAPRVAARARVLKEQPTFLRTVFAPLFAMGYFDATRRRRITTYTLTVMIIILIVAVQQLEQPWRGIIDVGVVAGLSWGLIATVAMVFIGLSRDTYDVSPELPEPATDEDSGSAEPRR